VSDEKNPVEQALDVFLYAPIGLVFSARELLPTLVEKGKSQIALARMMGQFATKEAGNRAGPLLEQAQKQAMSTLEHLAGARSNGASPSSSPSTNGAAPSPVIDTTAVASAPEAPSAPTSGPEAAELAIPDYDSLSASQVLPRLNGLAADELEAVRAYEAAHRGRKTILNRAAQLQASSAS